MRRCIIVVREYAWYSCLVLCVYIDILDNNQAIRRKTNSTTISDQLTAVPFRVSLSEISGYMGNTVLVGYPASIFNSNSPLLCFRVSTFHCCINISHMIQLSYPGRKSIKAVSHFFPLTSSSRMANDLMKTNAHNILCMQWLVMSNTNACIMSAPKEPLSFCNRCQAEWKLKKK